GSHTLDLSNIACTDTSNTTMPISTDTPGMSPTPGTTITRPGTINNGPNQRVPTMSMMSSSETDLFSRVSSSTRDSRSSRSWILVWLLGRSCVFAFVDSIGHHVMLC